MSSNPSQCIVHSLPLIYVTRGQSVHRSRGICRLRNSQKKVSITDLLHRRPTNDIKLLYTLRESQDTRSERITSVLKTLSFARNVPCVQYVIFRVGRKLPSYAATSALGRKASLMMTHVDRQLEWEVFAANVYARGSSRIFPSSFFFSRPIYTAHSCLSVFLLGTKIHHRQISAHERK